MTGSSGSSTAGGSVAGIAVVLVVPGPPFVPLPTRTLPTQHSETPPTFAYGRYPVRARMGDGVAGASADDTAVEECCVCMEAFTPVCATLKYGDDRRHDNALSCPARHYVCCACVRKMVRPFGFKRKRCHTGLGYRCPLCRANVLVSPMHVMVLVTSSWVNAIKRFGSFTGSMDDLCVQWALGCGPRTAPNLCPGRKRRRR